MERPPNFLDEQETLAQEVTEMQSLLPGERMALFCSIMRMIDNVWASLPFEEKWRRLKLAQQIDGPRPEPWWMGLKAEARP